MQQHGSNYFTRRPPPDPDLEGWSKVKIQLFRAWSCYIINWKGMEHRAPYKHIFSPYTHPHPVGWIKRLKKSDCGHVAYQIKEKEV